MSNVVFDEILGKVRAADVSGGTGGSSFEPVGGDGITVAGGTFTLVTADVADVLNGTVNTEAVDVKALRGALSVGQAVDVTSAPDNVTGDYKGTFTVTGSLGFASFPKFASGLSYLMLADLTATSNGTVTPSGTWLDGTTTAKSLTAGTSTRVAMLFNAANKARFTFASTGSVSVTNCREYEVTACSNEAIAYIAQLTNPDAFASYYLVKPDMVQPWTSIIDMGSSSAVTIASGLSYKLNAATGTHTLTVDTCPAGYDGRDAIIRITLGGSGVIQAVSPLQLGGALVPYAINNCVVRFRDGEAVLLVEDTLAGYVVTLTSGTGEGSLPYGLAASDVPYIAFSPSTDGTPVELSGATAAAEEVTVVGNGYTSTSLTGAVDCGTSKFTVANLGLNNVQIVGGTMTLGDAYIPSGSTVAVSGGGLAVEKVTGNGGVIDLGQTNIVAITATFGGITITNGHSDAQNWGGAIRTYNGTVSSCVISGNVAAYGGGIFVLSGGRVTVSKSVVSGNTGVGKDIAIQRGAVVGIGDSTIGQAMLYSSGGIELYGSNVIDTIIPRDETHLGTATISSGATLDLTGNTNATPIAPGGGITFESGGATVYPSAGSASAYMLGGITVPTIGNTNVVNLAGSNVVVSSGGTAYASGCTFSGGSAEMGGAIFVSSAATVNIASCQFTGNNASYGAAVNNQIGTLVMSGCVVSGNSGTSGGGVRTYRGTTTLVDCVVSGNMATIRGEDIAVGIYQGGIATTVLSGCTIGKAFLNGGYPSYTGAPNITLVGTNKIDRIYFTSSYGSGTVTLTSGAILDLTGNTNATPIAPGGGVIVDGGCTVINSAGSSVSIAGGTYTQINNDGTTE